MLKIFWPKMIGLKNGLSVSSGVILLVGLLLSLPLKAPSEEIGRQETESSDMRDSPSWVTQRPVNPSMHKSKGHAQPTGLKFRSGFESGSFAVHKNGRAKDIRGIDHSVQAPNNWDRDLQPKGRKFWINYVDYDQGGPNPKMLGADIVQDPEGGDNQVFYTWQKDAEKQKDGPYSRIQGELDRLFWKEFYYKVRFRLGSDIAKVNSSKNRPYSLSLVECFTGNQGHKKLARIILHKQGRSAPLTWRSEILNMSKGGHTLYRSSRVKPKYDQWQTLEFYIKSGDAKTGRYWVRLNESQVLFDERVATISPKATKNIVKGTILKAYGGNLVKEVKRKGGQVDIWFDDLEIWNRWPDHISEKYQANS